ncbi:FAD-binding oxidoreductase [Geobacter sp. DSM 9736]|uniref:FAD-binding oxidoreductase n=1 Tax=Geobacter sp. DSM 9736 TaxID=1277350 RepID=UPI000B5EDC32|nr:FAD-binding oxidoreductase [Geobacter sp. DSM 9736]SNB47115.1 FAD/FMN-containing dehydrogenase [Geobacter sp. DSM 9736]
MLNPESIEKFRLALRGELIQPGDVHYDEARTVYNAMIDRRPRMIVRCADVADVISCVNFARDNGITPSIRGGGHNAGGLGVCDDCLVIDLSRMRGIRVDPEARTVRVEGGCVWGDVDHATHAFGLATPSGFISTTGVAGLTLGGGIGHLTRSHGLTIDNLIEADVVLANGSLVTASAERNDDLYWAIRGGGGNFGVVTSFLFRLHPVHTVYAGPMLWELDQAKDLMRWYRNFIMEAPEEMTGFFAFLVVPPGPPFPEELHGRNVCGIVWYYAGALEKAEEAFAPIRRFKPPLLDLVGPLPHTAVQSMFDTLYPPGHQWYWKADFFNELSDEAIDLFLKFGSSIPTMQSTMHLYPINGAAHRVGRNDTAFSFRESNWAEVIVGVDPDPANKERIIGWAREYWDAMHPFSAGGAYINFMMEEGQERIRATYRDNYERLVAIKTKYDPGNLFRVNQNIKPRG